jgi:DNA-binding GntR family transcriptional regulator
MWKTSTLSDQVYEHLLRNISSGALPGGSPLRELELVDQLRVSRTPIREALARLAEYGLVEMRPNRTSFVRCLRRQEIVNAYEVREALEGLAVKRACGKLTVADFAHLEGLAPRGLDVASPGHEIACYQLDLELHRLIATRSGNPILAQEIRKLHDLLHLTHRTVVDRKEQVDVELREHLQILAALKAQDLRASRQALLKHLRTGCAFLVRCAFHGPAGDETRAPDASSIPAAVASA